MGPADDLIDAGHHAFQSLHLHCPPRHRLAPNPFWGWCTLAVCTPNHQGSKVEPGDWIAGFYDKEHGYKFLYAMEVSKRIHMNDYFKDPRFSEKKPRLDGSWMEQCGDNFYSLDEEGKWQQHGTLLHVSPDWITRDRRIPGSFVQQDSGI